MRCKMRATDLLSQLGRTVAYYPNMVKHFESVTATVLFCQFFYWHDKAHSSLGIYKTVEEITEETGLSYKEQLTARKKLVALGVLVENHKRLEHKIYYKINLDRVNELLESDVKNSPYSQTVTGGEPNSNVESNQKGSSLVSKNTTEITTDINTRDKSLVVDDENIDQPGDDFEEEIKTITDQPKKTTRQNIPYQKIVELYEQILPELPAVNILNDTRKSHIRARWNEHPNHQSLEFWKDFFEYVRASDFLMGKAYPKDGGRPFRANIDWLLKPVNFAKVTEGNYV